MNGQGYLVLVNISPTHWRFAVNELRQTIGRNQDAHIPVPDEFGHVSRRHAEIWYERPDIWVRDLGSRGGTKLNGIWLKPLSAVRCIVGDRLSLAGVEMRLDGPDSHDDRDLGAACNPATATAADSGLLRASPEDLALQDLIATLSAAELQILLWMRRGFVNDEQIARRLHRSTHTVRTQVANIFRKLEVNSRSGVLSLLHRVESGLA